MKPNKKKVFSKAERTGITKSFAQILKLPMELYTGAKALFPKYEIKGWQELFDYLVVSGVVYLKTDIIEILRRRKKDFVDRERFLRGERMKGIKSDRQIKQHKVFMYDKDRDALDKFCIEEDIRKFWIIEILFEEFQKENPVCINLIQTCKKNNVMERKKAISRMVNDEYVVCLPEIDAEKVLEVLTEKYDNRQFSDALIQEQLAQIAKNAQAKQLLEDEEEEFNAKITKLRIARGQARAKILEIDTDSDPNA